MQEKSIIANTTAYVSKYAVTLPNLDLFTRFLIDPTTVERIVQFFSNYDEGAVLSIYAYPREIDSYLLKFGSLDYENVKLFDMSTSAYGYVIPSDVLNRRTYAGSFVLRPRHGTTPIAGEAVYPSYLDYPPYTTYKLFLPCIGYVDIDPARWYNYEIAIYFVIDFENGAITYYAVDEANNRDIGQWQGQYGVEIAVTSSRLGEIRNQAITGTISGAIQMITGNPVQGGLNAVQAATGAMTKPAGFSGGTSGQGLGNAFNEGEPFIIESYVDPAESNADFAATHGLPLYEYKSLADVTGYTVIDEIHLTGFDTATEQELTEIEGLLKNGVHL